MTTIRLQTETFEQAQKIEELLSKINFVHDIIVEENEMDEFTISKLEESKELYLKDPASFKSWEEVKAEILSSL
jgi:hypothetical protein